MSRKNTPGARPSGLGPQGPLDDVMLRLKDKYRDMEAAYKRQIRVILCVILVWNVPYMEADIECVVWGRGRIWRVGGRLQI